MGSQINRLKLPCAHLSREAYLEDGDGSPQDIIKMFPVALTLRVVRDDFGACTVPLGAIVLDEFAKLTTE